MKTIQMTIDETLLEAVDEATQSLNTSRSAFIRHALHLALLQFRIRQLEARHIEGYIKNPVPPGEFDIWQEEQSWSEA